MSSVNLFKALADNSRLRILENLKKEPMYGELLAERLGLAPSTLSFHLKKLMACGLITSNKEQYYVLYSLNNKFLDKKLEDLLITEDSKLVEEQSREEKYKEKVLKTFFEYGYVSQMPVQKKKKDIIIMEIFRAFEKGKEYTEKEVNEIIRNYYEDYCLIRRTFIEYKLMSRDEHIYKVI